MDGLKDIWRTGNPNVNGEYLVYFQRQRCVLEFKDGRWLWGDGSRMCDDYQRYVTHWTELIDKPEEV
jgi:hypothetical protein